MCFNMLTMVEMLAHYTANETDLDCSNILLNCDAYNITPCFQSFLSNTHPPISEDWMQHFQSLSLSLRPCVCFFPSVADNSFRLVVDLYMILMDLVCQIRTTIRRTDGIQINPHMRQKIKHSDHFQTENVSNICTTVFLIPYFSAAVVHFFDS